MSNFTKVDQVSLGDAVLKQFLDLINSGVYKVGDKLPGERELCSELNVSRPVLREVLSVLRHMGYVETVQGGGTFIRKQPLSPAVTSIKFNLLMDEMKTLEIWEVRNLLETEIAGYAAERGGEKEIQSINDAFHEYRCLVEQKASQELINKASFSFHNAISMAAHNDTIKYLLDAVASMLSESREKTGRVKGSNERSLKEHQAIAEAIAAHDVKAARRAMKKHMESVRKDLEVFLEAEKQSVPE